MENKKNNKGLSLIEVLVTIAIMAIAVGVGVSLYSWIRTHRLTSMTETLDSKIGDTRSYNMTKSGNFELVVKEESSKFVAEINNVTTNTNVSKTTIGNGGSIEVKVGGAKQKITGNKELHIRFSKNDGSYSQIAIYNNGVFSGDLSDNSIKLSYQNRSRTITLVKLTGKHYINK